MSEDGCCSLMEGIDLGRGGGVVGWEGDVEDRGWRVCLVHLGRCSVSLR